MSRYNKLDLKKRRIILCGMNDTLKSGDCYMARLPNGESPVRLVEKTENGCWKTRSLKHGRVVIVKNESLFLRHCTENDLLTCAVSIQPNRRQRCTLDRSGSYRSEEKATLPLVAHRLGIKTKPKPPKPAPFGMTALDAACRILKEAKTALTCKEIVERAEKRKFWRSNDGATPHYTLHTAIIREINRLGEKARFVKVGRGLFTVKSEGLARPSCR